MNADDGSIIIECLDCTHFMLGPRDMKVLQENWSTFFCTNCKHKSRLDIVYEDGSPKRHTVNDNPTNPTPPPVGM